MTIAEFARHRFAPADLDLFVRLAAPRLARGLEYRFERQTTTEGDSIAMILTQTNDEVFSFCRNRGGKYSIWFQMRGGYHRIGEGWTAQDCLGVWLDPGCTSLGANSSI